MGVSESIGGSIMTYEARPPPFEALKCARTDGHGVCLHCDLSGFRTMNGLLPPISPLASYAPGAPLAICRIKPPTQDPAGSGLRFLQKNTSFYCVRLSIVIPRATLIIMALPADSSRAQCQKLGRIRISGQSGDRQGPLAIFLGHIFAHDEPAVAGD